jgi:hypothetical protein
MKCSQTAHQAQRTKILSLLCREGVILAVLLVIFSALSAWSAARYADAATARPSDDATALVHAKARGPPAI